MCHQTFFAPPQARMVGNRKTQVHCELPQLVDSQGLCQYIGFLQMCVDVLQIDISNQDRVSDDVIVHLDVLGLSVKDWIPSQLNNAHFVVVEENRICHGSAQILQFSFSSKRLHRRQLSLLNTWLRFKKVPLIDFLELHGKQAKKSKRRMKANFCVPVGCKSQKNGLVDGMQDTCFMMHHQIPQ